MGMTAALTGYVASFWGFPPFWAIFTGLALGASIGYFHGSLIARFGMPAFIVTLAGLSMWRGTGHLSTGAQATPKLPEAFDGFGRYNPLSPLRDGFKDGTLPEWVMPLGRFVDANWLDYFRTFQMSMILFIAIFIIVALIVSNTAYGRYVYAIGSNEAGARQAGINTIRYKIMTYVICSTFAALGALLFLGRAPYAKSDYGQMWELDAIAAVVIGGTSLFGGRGTILGTFFGVILLKLINNGLTLAQLNTFWQMIVTGLIILIAVGLDIVRQSRDDEIVRKFLASIGVAMAFFTLLTPGAIWMRAKVALIEHHSAFDLKEAGVKLAPSQNARLLSENDVEMFVASASANLLPSLLCLSLLALSLVPVLYRISLYSFVVAGLFMAVAIFLAFGPLAQATPFLILGAAAIFGSTLVTPIFERAKALKNG